MKKITLYGIIIGIVIGMIIILSPNVDKNNPVVFHVTLADPKMYTDGIYEKTLELDTGSYSFSFVPNGDSPKILSILIDGNDFHFSENFKLVGTLHKTGISEYYTWDYNGQKIITISKKSELRILINPNGETLGPVSIDIIRE